MSFAIEVPGEANPLTLETLLHALQATQSNNGTQLQAAAKQLTSWEQHAGYYSSLQTVYLDSSVPYPMRFLAVIQLKNGIDKYWRIYAQGKTGLKPDEKAAIRSRLFAGTIDEADEKLAMHNALVLAKVVRIDYPNDWPDALTSIIELLRSGKTGNQQRLSRTLQVLLRVVNELGSARLRKSQTALQSVTPELFYVLNTIYSETTSTWVAFLTSGQGSENDAHVAMHISYLALKVLRRLLIHGYERPYEDETVHHFWTLSYNQFVQLLSFAISVAGQNLADRQEYQVMVEKHLLQFAKLYIDMAEKHAASFSTLQASLPLVRAYWDFLARVADIFDKLEGTRQSKGDAGSSKAKTEGKAIEKLAVKGLLLLRACVRIAFQPIQTFKYRDAKAKEEEEKARKSFKNELFKDDLVLRMVETIINRFFMFRTSDLDAWENDPEEWEQEQQSEGNAYEWAVRPCAEKLFLDLLTNFKHLIIPDLLLYFQKVQPPDASNATKEAVYTAMGLAAAHVSDVFDFGSVLGSAILRDAKSEQKIPDNTNGFEDAKAADNLEHRLYKVLQRRIAILISQWAPVKLADSSRPVVYEIFHYFLMPPAPVKEGHGRQEESHDDDNLVVRITAARELRWIADELDFSVEAFLPHTAGVLSQLIQLIQNVVGDETKLAILESVRILVTRMEEQVSQFGDQLMAALPGVWEESDTNEYMIKQAIIAIFAALVMSMGENSQRYHSFTVPLLSEAARPGSDLHVHLIDESLELWNAILMQSKAPLAPEIVNLAELALPLLEYHSETASQALTAIESYILIAPSAMLDDRLRRPVLTALAGTLDSKSREQVRLGTVCIEYLVRAGTELGGSNGISVLVHDMLETGFMNKIMTNLSDAWEAHQTTGPNRKISKLNTVTEGDYFAILARIALAEPHLFVQMLTTFGNLEDVWRVLSSEWFSYLSSTDHPERQKLYLLGLTRLLELPLPMQNLCLSKLQDYFDMWTNVISEVQDGVLGGPDTLVWGAGDLEGQEYDTPKSVAERDIQAKDPVHSVPAFGFVAGRLQDIVSRVGGESSFEEQWAVNVDKEVLGRFRQLASAAQQQQQ